MSITITVDDAAVQRMFARLVQAGRDLTPALRGVGQELETRISERFESRTDPDGIRWADLRPATSIGNSNALFGQSAG